MKNKIKQWVSRLNNFYVIFAGAFILWMAFFDGNNLYNQYEQRRRIEQLRQERHFYKTSVEKLQKEIAELNRNPKMLEKFARERFLMKKPNEDIYVVEE
ncbi:MAG: septum formation initiator family protein [Cytophagales bacterium]|nr:septum formation initiator family protein [Bernardetiaceae bacterium]MDW8204144.1 septum formation initiator family protein [Cytophagales bacterium]